MEGIKAAMLVLLLAGVTLSAIVGCHSRCSRGTPRKALLEQFEAAGQMVAEGHYDSTFGGNDWHAIRSVYGKLVARACCEDEFYALVNKMLFTLGHSHLGIVPPGKWPELEPTTFAEGSIGADVRMFGDDVVLTRVVEGSPAHRAGLRTGWRLTSIDGRTTEQIIEDRLALLEPPGHQKSSATNGVEAKLYGPAGTRVDLTAVGPSGTRVEVCLVRDLRAQSVELDSSYPPFRLELETRVLPAGVGYVRFNTFAPVLVDEVLAAVDSLRAAPALVIDLRGNPGGVRAVADQLAAKLLSRPTPFSAVETRHGRHEVRLEPARNPYHGAVVILVDEMTRSASEYFAGCLQSVGRAVVVGQRTPGSVGPALGSKRFDNGAVLVGPVGRTTTVAGTVLEGRGVIPDVELPLDRALLEQGRDTQIESAAALACSLPTLALR